MTPPEAEIVPADLVGSWNLRSWLIHYPDGRETGMPFGSDPSGWLQYHPDGSMSATVHRSDREPFPAGISPRRLDSDLVARAYRSYFHYAGLYRIEGDCVIHSVLHSLNQAMVGTDQVRRMQLEPPILTLTGDETYRDGTRRHELVWERRNV